MSVRHQGSRMDTSWDAWGAAPNSNEWITNPISNATAAVTAHTQSQAIFIPMNLPMPVTFNQWSVYVTTAGGTNSVTRVGAYWPDAKNRPGKLIGDYGTVDTSTTGSKIATASGTLPGGFFYLCVVPQGTGVLKLFATDPITTFSMPLPAVFTNAAASNFAEFRQSSVTGALPATASASPVALTQASTQTPMVGFRAA